MCLCACVYIGGVHKSLTCLFLTLVLVSCVCDVDELPCLSYLMNHTVIDCNELNCLNTLLLAVGWMVG